MFYELTHNDLVVPVYTHGGGSSYGYVYPLTLGETRQSLPATRATALGLGAINFSQFTYSNALQTPGIRTVICGENIYSKSRTDWQAWSWEIQDDGSLERVVKNYTYNENYSYNVKSNGVIEIKENHTGDNYRYLGGGNHVFGTAHAQTESSVVFKTWIPPEPPETEGSTVGFTHSVGLSEPVTTENLVPVLSAWSALSGNSKVGNTAISMAYHTESTKSGGAVCVCDYSYGDSYPNFSKTVPSGESEYEFWDGKYSVHVLIETQQLIPALMKKGEYGGSGYVSAGYEMYNTGSWNTVLSNRVPNNKKYVDDWGLFGNDTVLNKAPKLAGNHASPYYNGDGRGHEVVFISIDGTKLRLTLEVRATDYFTGRDIISRTAVTTDSSTLQVKYRFPATNPDGMMGAQVSVPKIERWTAVEKPGLTPGTTVIKWEWVVVKDGIVSSTPGFNVVALAYTRYREGNTWGHSGFKTSESTYRVKTTVANLGIKADGEKPSCGATSVSGRFSLEVMEEYSDTSSDPLEPVASKYKAVAGGIDWTPSDYKPYFYKPSGGTTPTPSNTNISTTYSGKHDGAGGGFYVRCDSASGAGAKVISQTWTKLPVPTRGSDATIPMVAFTNLPTPAPGTGVKVVGYRLTPE